MATPVPLSKNKLFVSEKYAVILVFAVCVGLRAIPELAAYPHPIGYDVVNYYIPFVANFEENWSTTMHQFPLYLLILHFVQIASFLPAQSVVASVAVTVFGIFGASLYLLGRSLLKLSIMQSIFLMLFVIFQMAVLRTAWDLHRDVFALAAMMFAFILVGRKDIGFGLKAVAPILMLGALVVAADRMIGALFCISLVGYAVVIKRRDIAAISIFVTGLFCLLMFASYGTPDSIKSSIGGLSASTPTFYNSQNLLTLFAVVNGLLLAPALIGFFRMKSTLLRIPLLSSLVGSFSWLVFPEISLLVADRWIIICGIFLSIFAGYGILHLLRKLSHRFTVVIGGAALASVATMGLAYAIMPYDNPFFLYGLPRDDIEELVPVSMQFNSIDIEDSGKLLSAIEWINENTDQNAVILGEKHWRGMMEVYLEEGREYHYYTNDEQALAEATERYGGEKTYLIRVDRSSPELFVVENLF